MKRLDERMQQGRTSRQPDAAPEERPSEVCLHWPRGIHVNGLSKESAQDEPTSAPAQATLSNCPLWSGGALFWLSLGCARSACHVLWLPSPMRTNENTRTHQPAVNGERTRGAIRLSALSKRGVRYRFRLESKQIQPRACCSILQPTPKDHPAA